MAILKTNPMVLSGPWAAGWVLDYHSLSATPTGDPYHPFEMTYTELGGHLYRFKYRNDTTPLDEILETAIDFLTKKDLRSGLEGVVPVPPSTERGTQPVIVLAQGMAQRLSIPIFVNAVSKAEKTPSMKNIDDWYERQRVLETAIQVGKDNVRGKSLLLVDDLIQSGSTLRRSAEVLLKDAGAKAIIALVLTRTR
jgi:predicted amidophosphoribosyltransferase